MSLFIRTHECIHETYGPPCMFCAHVRIRKIRTYDDGGEVVMHDHHPRQRSHNHNNNHCHRHLHHPLTRAHRTSSSNDTTSANNHNCNVFLLRFIAKQREFCSAHGSTRRALHFWPQQGVPKWRQWKHSTLCCRRRLLKTRLQQCAATQARGAPIRTFDHTTLPRRKSAFVC